MMNEIVAGGDKVGERETCREFAPRSLWRADPHSVPVANINRIGTTAVPDDELSHRRAVVGGNRHVESMCVCAGRKGHADDAGGGRVAESSDRWQAKLQGSASFDEAEFDRSSDVNPSERMLQIRRTEAARRHLRSARVSGGERNDS